MDKEKVNQLNKLHPILSTPGTHKEKGWGMGYKVIMDLLKFSKGILHIESRLNMGTTVFIKLPSLKNEIHEESFEFFDGRGHIHS